MKRIAVAVTNDLTYDQRMQRICRSLARASYQVTLIGRELEDSISLGQEPYRQVRLRCWFNKGPAFYAEYNFRLWLYLVFHGIDIAVACDLDTALAVRWSSRLRKRKTVFDAHELFTEVPELIGRNLVRRMWSWIGKWTVPGFTLRYTVGSGIARILSEKYGVSFAVIRNVPEFKEDEVLDLKDRRKIILYQGALNAGRGLEQVIDAMKHIEGFTLQLAGEGDLSDTLRQRVLDAGLTEKVDFVGRVPPAMLPDMSKHATLGLNLLEPRSQSYYYSLANKFFDYMHAGLPSVNMDFPEYRNIIDRNGVGICLDRLDVQSIGSTLSGLLADEQRLELMIRNCRLARVQFTWEKESDRLLELYAGLQDVQATP